MQAVEVHAALEFEADGVHQHGTVRPLAQPVDGVHAGDAHHGAGQFVGEGRIAQIVAKAQQAIAGSLQHQPLPLQRPAVSCVGRVEQGQFIAPAAQFRKIV